MTIEIHQPKLEALIQQRMASGAFQSVEDLLMQTLELAPSPALQEKAERRGKSGLELLEVMQAMPYKEINIEPSRPRMPVRDVTL